jgi:hypothetical protein
VQAKQLEEKLKRIEGHADEKARELGARIAYLESREAEAASELEAAEEEKYTLAADLEVVQEELEDANAHQKRYYEALMAKEEGLKKMKAQCGALQKAVAKLQYEADLQQTRAESAGIAEEADLSADYGHASSKKDQELKRLRQQLEAMQEEGVEDDDDLDQFGGGRRGRRMASAGAERAGGVDNYGEEQRRRRQEEEQAQARASLEADAKRLRAQQAALDDERKRMAQRAAAAEARADDLGKRAQTFEAKAKAQEREILQLISAKENAELRGGKPPPADAGGGGGDGGAGLEERVGELEDELYEAQQRAEEEADRAKQLEAEKEELLSQVRMLSHGT